MSNHKLTNQEKAYIQGREQGLRETINLLQKLAQFKEGDFLIAYHKDRYNESRDQQVKNSYGAPKKFTVVHVDANGVPYMKELNKNGEPTGVIISPIHADHGFQTIRGSDYRFEVDPDFIDATIMADEENYDPTAIHRSRGNAFKEITKHNKSLKVNVNEPKELLVYLQSLKAGDVIWRSIRNHFTILSIDPIPTTHGGTHIKDYTNFGTAQDSKGNVFDLNLRCFKWKAIYRGQPRSYNELKDPK